MIDLLIKNKLLSGSLKSWICGCWQRERGLVRKCNNTPTHIISFEPIASVIAGYCDECVVIIKDDYLCIDLDMTPEELEVFRIMIC